MATSPRAHITYAGDTPGRVSDKRCSYAVTASLRPHFLLQDPGRPMGIEIRESP